MFPDTYDVYREWYLSHYGREFPCTREQWRQWCAKATTQRGARDLDQEEIERERQEGWGYGYVR